MKKVKILSHPTQIAKIQLDDLAYDTTAQETHEKINRLQIRKWRKLRHEMAQEQKPHWLKLSLHLTSTLKERTHEAALFYMCKI